MTVDLTANCKIYSIWCLDASLPTLKERRTFALPSCHSTLLFSRTKSPLPFCPPTVASPSSHILFPKLLCQRHCPNHSTVQPILLHDQHHTAGGFRKLLLEQILNYLCTAIQLWNLSWLQSLPAQYQSEVSSMRVKRLKCSLLLACITKCLKTMHILDTLRQKCLNSRGSCFQNTNTAQALKEETAHFSSFAEKLKWLH